MPDIYTHPDTGEQIEIPEGSQIVRNGDHVDTQVGPVLIDVPNLPAGEIVYWRNPSPITELHEEQIENYTPVFDRASVHRRVLMHITDEVDVTLVGPRNTVPALAYGISRDGNTPQIAQPSITALRLLNPNAPIDLGQVKTAEDQVQEVLDVLVKAELVADRGDGSYEVTPEGRRELVN